MTLYEKRNSSFVKKLENEIGLKFSKFGLSPNLWSLFVLISAILASIFILKRDYLVSCFFVFLSGFFDLVDGSVARAMGKVTKFGAYLDTIIDRYSEFIIILALSILNFPNFIFPFNFWLFLYLFGSLMTTYVKAAAKEKNLTKEEIKGGILERAERIIFLTVGIFSASINEIYLVYFIILLSILSNISAIQRIFITIKKSK